jgi:hypothetical protein
LQKNLKQFRKQKKKRRKKSEKGKKAARNLFGPVAESAHGPPGLLPKGNAAPPLLTLTGGPHP